MLCILPFSLVLTAGLFIPVLLLAQEGDLKKMEWLIGEWTNHVELPDGQIMNGVGTFEWLHDKKFLRHTYVGEVDGEVTLVREISWYWDPVDQVVRGIYFDKDGSWGRGSTKVDDGIVTTGDQFEGVDADGKPRPPFTTS